MNPYLTIPWFEIKVLPDFNDNGHLIEGERPKEGYCSIQISKNENIHYVKRAVATGGDIVKKKDKILYLHPKREMNFKAN